MEPCYDEGGATIFRTDGLRTIQSLSGNSIDAIVTDPPYCAGGISEAQRTRAAGQGLRSENLRRFGWFVGDNMGTAGLVWLLRAIAFESVRVVKPTGSMVVFCDWRMIANVQPAIESAGLRFQNLIVWDKGQMGLGNGFRNQHELALHFTYGSPEYHDKGTPNLLTTSRIHASERLHQTQKPTDLLSRIIRVVAPPGGAVFDPFGGSFSTAVACKETGRRFVGSEREVNHCETAIERLSQQTIAFPD